MALTIKQENFCLYYIETGNATEAYRRAYDASRMKPDSACRKAFELLENVKITARVEELRQEVKDKSTITRERILEELENIAFSSIAHLHNTWIELKEFDCLTDKQKASIKSISTKVLKKNIGTSEDPEIIDVESVKIELHDKLKALESINKMMGYEAPKEVNVKQILLDIQTGTDE